jgi:hypothetical protein
MASVALGINLRTILTLEFDGNCVKGFYASIDSSFPTGG